LAKNQDKGNEQSEVIAFLLRPESYRCSDESVTRIDTHISVIFLIGDRAFKMKRALRFAYLDYATLARRRQFCEAEFSLNRRTAPNLYLHVIPVTREDDGSLRLNGAGVPVEWLLEMTRFEQDALFDKMAMGDRLTPALMTALADSIAGFHAAAEVDTKRNGTAVMRWVVDGNNVEIDAWKPAVFEPEQVERLRSGSLGALHEISPLLDVRAKRDRIRRCHGDLHLRNICLLEGRPTLFDGIEFNDAITVIDVLYDLAFLLMDLEHRGHRDLANLVFNRYMAMTEEHDGLPAMSLFLSCRAAVRAHTTAAAAVAQNEAQSTRSLYEEARTYLELACDFLVPKPACLIAIGGLSGTGKSTLGHRIAPLVGRAPGALLLRSDVIRKRLFDVSPEAALDATAYTPEQSARVYARLQRDAAMALDSGYCVVTDAVFARPDERNAIEALAISTGIPLIGLWLDAPADTLQKRVTERTGDASDADAAVVRQQLTYEIGSIDWHVIDASLNAEKTFAAARKIVTRLL
jgi:aminoglycoside phosphotransferase family enzyme/predicted kinase